MPACDKFPLPWRERVRVRGLNDYVRTRNIVEASHRFEAERFIMISTDKAVRPSSVMGATTRVAEMITSCYAMFNPTRFVSVRFGNVIGSEGSVVHLFRKQIVRYGPVTVTHPEMTRYFMTIPEACKLILQAGALGEGGEIFILDMGTPIIDCRLQIADRQHGPRPHPAFGLHA